MIRNSPQNALLPHFGPSARSRKKKYQSDGKQHLVANIDSNRWQGCNYRSRSRHICYLLYFGGNGCAQPSPRILRLPHRVRRGKRSIVRLSSSYSRFARPETNTRKTMGKTRDESVECRAVNSASVPKTRKGFCLSKGPSKKRRLQNGPSEWKGTRGSYARLSIIRNSFRKARK